MHVETSVAKSLPMSWSVFWYQWSLATTWCVSTNKGWGLADGLSGTITCTWDFKLLMTRVVDHTRTLSFVWFRLILSVSTPPRSRKEDPVMGRRDLDNRVAILPPLLRLECLNDLTSDFTTYKFKIITRL